MILAKCWCAVENSHENSSENFTMDINHVFANRSDEEEIFPLTVSEISEEQFKDKTLQQQKGLMKYEETLVENTYVLCKEGKLVIPKTLQKSSSLVPPLFATFSSD